jgi:hypothetical protein
VSLNRWQATRQVAYKLGLMAWGDSPTGKVLASALVSTRKVEEIFPQRALPFAVVRPPRTDNDEAVPPYAQQATFDVEVVAQNVSDRYETGASLGANRPSLGQSPGRGTEEIVTEIEKAFLGSTGTTHATDSVDALQARVKTVYEPEPLDDGHPGAVKHRLTIVVYNLVADRCYHAPSSFTGVAGAQFATLTWLAVPNRFDFVGYQIVRNAGGHVATSPSDGTTLFGSPATGLTSIQNNVGSSGTFTWTMFAVYDEWSATPTNTQRWSTALSVTLTI